jgi:pectate lyase-like protein
MKKRAATFVLALAASLLSAAHPPAVGTGAPGQPAPHRNCSLPLNQVLRSALTAPGLPATGPWIDVCAHGAKGDGKTDDTAAIQSAFDAAARAGGGAVLLRRGTYLVSPTPSSHLAVPSNVQIIGEGAATVIRVKENAGDYETIFGAATDTTHVENVSIRSLAIDQNPNGNRTCNIHTGDKARAQFAIAFFDFKNITVDGVRFDPATGINTITLNGAKAEGARVSNCYFRFVQGATTSPSYDNSAVYLECMDHQAIGNTFVADIRQRARGAIETHGGPSVVAGNLADGYQTGVNIVTAFANESVRESNDITVVDNTFSRADQGIKLWSGTHRTLRSVTVAHNTLSLSQAEWNSHTSSGISMIYDSVTGTVNGDYEDINIQGNTITFQDEGPGRSRDYTGAPLDPANTFGIGLSPAGNITNILVTGNIITRAPTRGIRLGNAAARNSSRNVQITNNMITDAGQNSGVVKGYRAGISLEGALAAVAVTNNSITDTGDPLRGYQSICAYPTSALGVSLKNNAISATHGSLYYNVDRTKGIDDAGPR